MGWWKVFLSSAIVDFFGGNAIAPDRGGAPPSFHLNNLRE
jgi:hypothetical protein